MLPQEIFENRDVKGCTLAKFREQISWHAPQEILKIVTSNDALW